MIIFDYEKYLKKIKNDGVRATDIHASKKIDAILTDMIFNSTYKKGQVLKRTKNIADDYYKGLPDDIAIDQLSAKYDEIKNTRFQPKTEKKILTLYRSEMETIDSLPNDKLKRLAFASLVAFKYLSYHEVMGEVKYNRYIAECMSDIYDIAQFDTVSGTERNRMQNELVKHGLVTYWIKENKHYRFDPSWIAFTRFSVPFCVEVKGTQAHEEVYMNMTNYDDIMLYLRYFQGDENVTICECCGTPILRSANGKRYCSDCADQRKKSSDRTRYKNRKAC